MANNLFHSLRILGFSLLLTIPIAVAGYWSYTHFFASTPPSITNLPPQFTYEDCVLKEGSVVSGEYNHICTATDGTVAIADINSSANPTTADKIQECPSNWVIETGSTLVTDSLGQTIDYPVRKEYMVFNNKKVDVQEIDVEWVTTNCEATAQQQPLQSLP